MASPAVTYTFTNSTTADATQVNQNFSDLIAGMTDGSKSFSIDALTVAGATLLNGTVGRGNASADDITFTGYVASAITPKTDDTYDLGTAALAWQDLYLDGICYTDTITELTTSNGVVIEDVTMKDGAILGRDSVMGSSTAPSWVAAGYKGEVLNGTSAWSNAGGNGVWTDLITLTLTKGSWILFAHYAFYGNGATSSALQGLVSTTSGNSATGSIDGVNNFIIYYALSGTVQTIGGIHGYVVEVTATSQAFYQKFNCAYSGGTPQSSGRFTALRIA